MKIINQNIINMKQKFNIVLILLCSNIRKMLRLLFNSGSNIIRSLGIDLFFMHCFEGYIDIQVDYNVLCYIVCII